MSGPGATNRPLLVLASLAVIGALYWAQQLLIPLAFAILLSLLLRPVVRRLRQAGVNEIWSSSGAVALVAGVFTLGIVTLAGQGQKWLADAPQVIGRMRALVPANAGPLSDFTKATEAVRDLTQTDPQEAPVPVAVHSSEPTFAILGASGHFFAAALIVFVVAFFLLSFSDPILQQLLAACDTSADQRSLLELIQNVETGVSRYLATITMINVGLGVASACVLWLLSIPNPILWGVLVATLNFIPHVGAFICMGVLFVVGAAVHESLAYGAAVAGAFALLTTAESYFITPMVLSNSLKLSPLAVILSVLFWGWLWGIAGGLMAAPVLAILKIVCDQYEPLKLYGALLSGESESTTLRPTPAATTQLAWRRS